MSQFTSEKSLSHNDAIVGEPEVVEDGAIERTAAWLNLKAAVAELRLLQAQDGSIPVSKTHAKARRLVETIRTELLEFRHLLPHDSGYLEAAVADFTRWADDGLGVPDFLDSLTAFQPQKQRVDGLRHLVVFPMYTQNGSTDRLVEAVLIEVIWPEFVAELEGGAYGNKLFVPIRFLDFTDGYDTNSAVLFPETVAMREIPRFTWGAIFADREAARFRRVVRAASEITKLDLPDSAARLLDDQKLTEETFVMWDLIHDRTHMRGDLPFDPFMIKQRMPYFLYSLEELRCDLTAFRESVKLSAPEGTVPVEGTVPEFIEGAERGAASSASATGTAATEMAGLVQYAIIFDRIFRFPLTGSRVRNYDGLGGQLLFAWLHQHHVLHWTDTQLTIDWDEIPDVVIALSDAINELYWRSIDRPKIAHWLAAYDLVAETLTPNPSSKWAVRDLPLDGPPRALTDAVLDDEFPLSMFYEALAKKMVGVIESTSGITGRPSARVVD
jgi:Family of unknown function (DUF6421)